MLKTTLLAAAALVAFGATAAYAGHDGGRYRGGKHGGYEYNYKPRPRPAIVATIVAGTVRATGTFMARTGLTIAGGHTATTPRARPPSRSGTAGEIPIANGFGRT